MSKVFLILLFSAFTQLMHAQVVFWSEDFENNCNSGCAANGYSGLNGAWSVTNTGTNGSDANLWYVSCAENGQTAGVCGAGCGTDESMHVSSSIYGDIGAAYLAGGMGTVPETNKRMNSPAINCAGKSNITLSFVYIENGENTIDNATLMVSYDGGTTWGSLDDMPKTPICAGGQGRWQAYSIVLPAAADNNSNLKIGFNWINNNNTGTDPSFAVDDIQLSSPAPMPVTLTSFEGYCNNGTKHVLWTTASETNNDHFEIERAYDGVQFETIGVVAGSGNSNSEKKYDFTDNSESSEMYYRLRQVDFDGAFVVSQPIFIRCNSVDNLQSTQVFYDCQNLQIEFQQLPVNQSMNVLISDLEGKIVEIFQMSTSTGDYTWMFSPPSSGIYFVNIVNSNEVRTIKLAVN